jgi:hypothetical protein
MVSPMPPSHRLAKSLARTPHWESLDLRVDSVLEESNMESSRRVFARSTVYAELHDETLARDVTRELKLVVWDAQLFAEEWSVVSTHRPTLTTGAS